MIVLAFALGCRASPSHPPDSLGNALGSAGSRAMTWTYTASLGANAADIAVRLCFAGEPAAALRPVVPEALEHVAEIAIEGRDGVIRASDGVVPLVDMRPNECVRWRVDLDAIAETERNRDATRLGDSVLVRQSMWLLWPSDAPKDAAPIITLELPDGVDASVPWRPLPNQERTYVLEPTAARWLGYNAFGRVHAQQFDYRGARIEIARLDEPITCGTDCLRAWIIDALDGAATLYGDYPRDRLQIIVVPVGGRGGGGVHFGAAARGGGPGVYLVLDANAKLGDIVGGWTTVHELLHHGMPFVKDPWMSEGFVSYYTEITRTRQGHRTEKAGWRELWDAFERGRSRGRAMTLDATSRNMHETHAYQRVYWGGAAIAFDIDVTMRLDSGGKRSFDDAMKHLRACCGDATSMYDAKVLLEELDRWYGKPIFTRIANEHLQTSEFPDIASIYARLGMRHDGVAIEMDDRHPAAAQRAAIMALRSR
jgi:hypothetical protein